MMITAINQSGILVDDDIVVLSKYNAARGLLPLLLPLLEPPPPKIPPFGAGAPFASWTAIIRSIVATAKQDNIILVFPFMITQVEYVL